MGKRTGGERGAPLGNRNRLKHGLYSLAYAERAAFRALIAECEKAIEEALGQLEADTAAARRVEHSRLTISKL